jgi:hypothetical protein
VRNAAAIKKLFSEAAHSHTIAPATQAVVSSIEGGITAVDLNTTGEMGGSIILFDEVATTLPLRVTHYLLVFISQNRVLT